MLTEGIFFQIGIIIILATLGGYIARLLKQPLIPSYIVMGIIIGPVLHMITDASVIQTLAEIGISFLLFTVGLELDINKLKDVGSVASIGGLASMVLSFALGYLIAIFLGFSVMVALYIGIIMMFSSTMVVIKILSDKNELDTLHGKISIGMLLMQDVVAILVITILASVNDFAPSILAFTLAQGIGFMILAYFLARYVFPEIFKFAAKNQELLFLLGIAVCFAFAILANLIGFSIAIGSFIAGVALGSLPYNVEISSKTKTLKDFFGVLFFAAIGLELGLTDLHALILPAIIFLLFVLLIKPFLNYIICIIFGYTKRTSYITAISLAQVSEFSLIIVAQGLLLSHVDNKVFSFTVLLALITIASTSYVLKYENFLYRKLHKFLGAFDHLSIATQELHFLEEKKAHHHILIGYNRMGYSILKSLDKLKKDFVIIDYNPNIIKKLIEQKIPCIYGDIGDLELLDHLKLKEAKAIISTTPEVQSNKLLIKKIKEKHGHAVIIVTAMQVEEALELYDEGADYVIVPHLLGGQHASIILEDVAEDFGKLLKHKETHIKELHSRHHYH